MKTFSETTLLSELIKKYAHLNDDNTTANMVYRLIKATKLN